MMRVKYVKNRLEGKSLVVHEELHSATVGGLRMTDIKVVELENSALILDVQIVSEQQNLEEANVDK